MSKLFIAMTAILAVSQAHADDIFASRCTGASTSDVYFITLNMTDKTATFGTPETALDKAAQGKFSFLQNSYFLLRFADAAMVISGDGAGRLIIDGVHSDFTCTPLAKLSDS